MSKKSAVENVVGWLATRADSWFNAAMGMGGIADKLTHTRYSGIVRALSDPELTAMFRTEHFSRKIVDVYPREALREGFELGGLPEEDESTATPEAQAAAEDLERAACEALTQARVLENVRKAAIWARLYGKAVVWKGSFTTDPAAPFVLGERVDFLRVVDRRFLIPRPMPLDEQGQPVFYDVVPEEGGPQVGPIHASRLVIFRGARTDAITYRAQNWCDDSVLQNAFDALKSEGTLWRSVEQLVAEASLGVLRVKDLYTATSNPQAKERLAQRLGFFNASRGIAKNFILDLDKEDYKRDNATFAGLSDLSDAGVKRIASAAEIPVAILYSDEPSGLNSTGDSSTRWWLMRVHAYRVDELEAQALDLARAIVCSARLVSPEQAAALTIKWPNLWTPSAAEQAEIRLKNSQADASDIDKGILTPEEAALGHYGDDGYSQDIEIDRDLRAPPSEADIAAGLDAGATGPTGAPADANAPPPEDVQKTALNGAQLASALTIVQEVAKGSIPRESGIALILLGFPDVSKEQATALMGPENFEPTKEPAPAPFGGALKVKPLPASGIASTDENTPPPGKASKDPQES